MRIIKIVICFWAVALSSVSAAKSDYRFDLFWDRTHRELIRAGGEVFEGWTTERTGNSITLRCSSCDDGAFVHLETKPLPSGLRDTRGAWSEYMQMRKRFCVEIVVQDKGRCAETRHARVRSVPGITFITDATNGKRTVETLLFSSGHVLRAVAKGERGSPVIENVGPGFPRILLSLTPLW